MENLKAHVKLCTDTNSCLKMKVSVPSLWRWWTRRPLAMTSGRLLKLTTPDLERTSVTQKLMVPSNDTMLPVSHGWPPPCGYSMVWSKMTTSRSLSCLREIGQENATILEACTYETCYRETSHTPHHSKIMLTLREIVDNYLENLYLRQREFEGG